MHDPAFLPGNWPQAAHDAQAQAIAMADHARRTLAVARGLQASGRRVDLSGLDRSIGPLCAKVLDLPPEQGRAARAVLQGLLAELDALGVAMQRSADDP